MNNGRVFVVQETMRRDAESGEMRRVHDLTPAAVYGELIPLLGAARTPLSPGPLVHELGRKLRGFSDGDHLLAVGDPIAIGIATAIAARENGGRVSMLKWDRETRSYIRVAFDIN